ncbi:MAG: 2-(1,2-epoxy-1,2-dihydrophenyl)acetyl-CoA isomerase, partial [Alphaproteobacteria bacterium]|nr:2-(1,2-epoxy-1,2-dihydrophenyl)acetyl-CoA isomerase [Alphaproteobacteria bacterium]
LLTGAGRGFCAGQDLSARKTGPDALPPDLGASLEKNYNPLVRALRDLEMPVVCAVNGVAAGAGANIALACDIVLAAESARFIQSFSKVGLVPDAGGTWTLPRLVGQARARGMALLAEPIAAAQAEAWGLIWKCLPDGELMPAATALARTLATRPTAALAMAKKAFDASAGNTLDRQLDLERDAQSRLSASADYREGVAAFLERREPKFTGR